LLSCLGQHPCAAAGDPVLTAGAARIEITPATNVLNWIGHKPYPGVLDPVFVRALVLSDGSNRVALITWDLTDTRERFVARVRDAVTHATGIPRTHILINASHNHSAPWVPSEGDPLVQSEHTALDPVQREASFTEWGDSLVRRTVDAVVKADTVRKPASLSIARAWAGDVVFNRRPVREDDRVETTFTPADPFWLPHGQRFGPTDPTVTVLAVETPDAPSIATVFSLPCHPVSVYPHDSRISADWPGPVSAAIAGRLGGEALFLQGCAGDVVPVRRGLPSRDRMAALIAERALAAWTNRHALKPAPLHATVVPVDLPQTEVARKETGVPVIHSEVQVVTCGLLAIVTLPGEPLTGLSLEIQRRSPYPHTLVVGYSNGGGVQYVGPAGEKRRGGYEMSGAGTGEDRCGPLLVDAAVGALAKARSEELVASTPPERFHLYLLLGQSNMAGRGDVRPADETPHPRVLAWQGPGRWQLGLDPLHHDRPNAGVGPGSWFGRAMADADPQAVIGLVPVAVGGSPLRRWERGGDLYQNALAQARAVQSAGVIRGILWHQGENDSDTEANAGSYASRLTRVIQDLRSDLGMPELPFVAGKLGEFLVREPRADTPFASRVNQQLESLRSQVPRFALVETDGLTPMADKIHFDTLSSRELGRRYADALTPLLHPK
jgi:hypothetical protein